MQLQNKIRRATNRYTPDSSKTESWGLDISLGSSIAQMTRKFNTVSDIWGGDSYAVAF